MTEEEMMMMGNQNEIFGPLMALLALGVIVLIIVVLVRWVKRSRAAKVESQENALNLLKKNSNLPEEN